MLYKPSILQLTAIPVSIGAFLVVSLLCYCYLQTKIDVNAANYAGNTALHGAVVYEGNESSKLCTLLLKYKVKLMVS